MARDYAWGGQIFLVLYSIVEAATDRNRSISLLELLMLHGIVLLVFRILRTFAKVVQGRRVRDIS